MNDDPLKDWEIVFNNDPMAAMAAKKKMDRPSSTMFKKLFRYIIGVNSDQAEIKMTRPVTTIRQKIKGKPGMETAVMCFWTGTPWANRKLPQPNDKSVFIQNRPELDVFVRYVERICHNQKCDLRGILKIYNCKDLLIFN